MSDGVDPNEKPNPDNGENPPDKALNTDKDIPYARFKEVNDKAKDLEKRLKAFEEAAAAKAKEDEEAANAKLIEEGKHKERAEKLEAKVKEYEPLAAQLEEANAAVTAVLQHKLESVTLPTVVKNLLAEKSPAQQLALITEYEKEMGTSDKGGARVPGTPNGSTGRGLTTDEQKRRGIGMSRFVRGG